MEALTASLIAIVLLILVSVLISFLVEKFNTKRFFFSNMVALLLLGIIISQINAMEFLKLNGAALAAFSTVALIIVAFHFSFLLKFSDLDSTYKKSLLRFLLFFALNLVLLTLLGLTMFGVEMEHSIIIAAIFSVIMTAVSPNIGVTKTDAYVSKAKVPSGRLYDTIRVEALVGLPLILLVPFILAGYETSFTATAIFTQTISIFYDILVGAAIGVLLALIIMVIVRSKYSEYISSIFLAVAAFIAYAITEQLGGNGIAAVIVLGLFYSSIYVKNRDAILEQSSAAMFILEAIALVVVAFAVELQFSWWFLAKALVLFGIYVGIRLIAVFLSCAILKDQMEPEEKIFIALQAPKGLSIIVVILALSNFAISGMPGMLSLAIYFVLLCHITSLIAARKYEWFIGAAKVQKGAIIAEVEETIETRVTKTKKEKKTKRRILRKRK